MSSASLLLHLVKASPVSEAEATPSPAALGHPPHPGYKFSPASYQPHCKLTYEVVTEEKCASNTVPECNIVVKNIPEEVCKTVEEQECHQEQQCTEHAETVHDTTTLQECEDVITKVCTNTQITTQSHTSVIGHEVGIPHGHPDIVPQPLFPGDPVHDVAIGGGPGPS